LIRNVILFRKDPDDDIPGKNCRDSVGEIMRSTWHIPLQLENKE